MASKEKHKKILMDHYKNPRNKVKEEMSDALVVKRGVNPQCGDEVEVGLYLDEHHHTELKFRGRGCSVCLASASMMTTAVSGKTLQEAADLCDATRDWLKNGLDQGVPETVATPELEVVLDYPARQKCAQLSWEALDNALKSV